MFKTLKCPRETDRCVLVGVVTVVRRGSVPEVKKDSNPDPGTTASGDTPAGHN
jgi:hypothetical protein